MEIVEEYFLKYVKTRADFRNWLEKNCETKKQCFVCIKSKKVIKKGLCYLDAVEEAICFGWIDSVFKKNEKGEFIIRFSPRRKNSNWTELNKERARRLIKLNKMSAFGRKSLPDLDETFVVPEYVNEIFKTDENLLKEIEKLPSLYFRIRIDNILKVKDNEKQFKFRLEKFIKFTKQGKMYGQWNDYGRLK